MLLASISIMAPDLEPPVVLPDEVGVPIGHPQVVYRGVLTRLHPFNDTVAAVPKQNRFTNRQVTSVAPAVRRAEERVLRGGADPLAVHR